jgi:hypothetical protein
MLFVLYVCPHTSGTLFFSIEIIVDKKTIEKNKEPEPTHYTYKTKRRAAPKATQQPSRPEKKRGKLFNIMPRTIIVFFCPHTKAMRKKIL